MITELYIEGQPADISTTLASLLTFAIDDIKDFASRSTAFSKTVVLPGSQRNNKLFGSVFDVAVRNDYNPAVDNININFNASVSANCILFQDFLQTFKGTIRILQINIDRGRIEYEAAITGELTKLNVALTSGLLEDLDFSAYDHLYDETSVTGSWNNPGGSGVYYPLIDYGTYSANKHDWDIRTFRPALYVKEYIDKMFEAANFRYSSNLFDSARFKSLIIPYNRAKLTQFGSEQMEANITSTHTDDLQWDNVSGTDWALQALNRQIAYNGATSLTGVIGGTIAGQYFNEDITVALRINGGVVDTQTFTFSAVGFPNFFTYMPNYNATINNTDYIEVIITTANVSGPGNFFSVTTGHIEFNSNVPTMIDVDYFDTIHVNDIIPRNIRQIDFLVSIIKLFNLYVYEDKFDERLLYIEPFVNFYSEDSTNAVDWTYKLARDKPVTIKPMSEINAKIYNFNYQDDSDYYNDLYKKRYNQTYGSEVFDTEFEFVTQTQDVEIIFASTPLVGYGGEEKVYPTIFKLNDNVEETTDSVIRIMQTLKITGVASWNILNGVTVLTSTTDYGYAGHFDNPDNVTNDLNFGNVQELFFVLVAADLSATQFNVYWSSYMAEITDKDSKLLTGKFYLTPADILNLDFSIYVNVDGNLFRLNKITDYNLTKPDLCECELLKVINTLY